MSRIQLSHQQRAAIVAALPPGSYTLAGIILYKNRATIWRNMQPKKRGWYDYDTVKTLVGITNFEKTKTDPAG